MERNHIIRKLWIWRTRHITDKYFILILSAIIGISSGLAAFVLKTLVYAISDFIRLGASREHHIFLLAFFPVLGVLLTILFTNYILKDKIRHGIPRILYVISREKSKMKPHKMYSSLLGSTLTAGFGASVGLESPIISTGAAIGSNISQNLRLNYKTTTLLIGCGAAGAMASIFNTPIAAVIFGLEVLLLDLATSSIVPLLIASVAGSLTTKFLLAERILINFETTDIFQISHVPYYIVLGVLMGLVSYYFSSIYRLTEKKLRSIKNNYLASLAGIACLMIIILIFPPLFGEGYDGLKLLISGNHQALFANTFFTAYANNHWIFLVFVILLMVFKSIATALSIESGGIGGIFAPIAFTGGVAGYGFSYLINQIPILSKQSTSNFTLVGMAAALAGVLHAPLTAIFLVAEITNGYDLIVPLMLTTTIAFVTSKIFDPHSIFTKQLAERGDLITHHKDQTVLTLLSLKDLVDTGLHTIRPSATLGDLVQIISKSHRNIFPVVDKDKHFYGIITLDEVREDMFRKELYNKSIQKYILHLSRDEIVSSGEIMQSVMDKFNRTGNYNMAVVDNDRYVGLVSRADIFKAYRKTLIDVTHE